MERDFYYFRDKYNEMGARYKFESSCATLLKAIYENAYTIRPTQGDQGIDIYIGEFGNPIDVYQCKYFINGIKSAQKRQIEDSFLRAAQSKTYQIREWILCVPTDLSHNEAQWFDVWKKAKEQEYNVRIRRLDGSTLIHMMQMYRVYDIVFEIEQSKMLSDILHEVKSISERTQKQNDLVNKNVKAMCEIILNNISSRIEVYHELHNKGWDLSHLHTESQYREIQDILQRLANMDDDFDLKVQEIVDDLKKVDYNIAHMCNRYMHRESKQIAEMESNIFLPPQYVYRKKGRLYQVMVAEFIEELQKDFDSIKKAMESHFGELKGDIKARIERRDSVTRHKGDLKSKYRKVFRQFPSSDSSDIEIVLGEEDDMDLFIEVLNDMIRTGEVSWDPMPSFIWHEAARDDLSVFLQYIIFKEEGLFLREFDHVFILFELRDEDIVCLKSLKNRSHIVNHFFLPESRFDELSAQGAITSKYGNVLTIE